MNPLQLLSQEQLRERLDAHTAGSRPHLPYVLVSHVAWPNATPREQLYEALCAHHRNSAPWEGAGRHLMVNADGVYWADLSSAWLPRAAGQLTNDAQLPAMIDMVVDTQQSRGMLRSQLQSVAAALLAIGNAFKLDDVPSVRWQSVTLRDLHRPEPATANQVATPCYGGA